MTCTSSHASTVARPSPPNDPTPSSTHPNAGSLITVKNVASARYEPGRFDATATNAASRIGRISPTVHDSIRTGADHNGTTNIVRIPDQACWNRDNRRTPTSHCGSGHVTHATEASDNYAPALRMASAGPGSSDQRFATQLSRSRCVREGPPQRSGGPTRTKVTM